MNDIWWEFTLLYLQQIYYATCEVNAH